MLSIAKNSQVTKVSYQSIESNFIWKIKNPSYATSYKSEQIEIPLINAKW